MIIFVGFLWDFYEPFIEKITQGKTTIASQKIALPTGEFCPECGKELIIRKSRYGEFIGCSGYPKCKYIKREPISAEESSVMCEKCGKPMVKKIGRRGEFLACSGYPECKNTKPLEGEKKSAKIIDGIPCPECGGDIIERIGRRGMFFGCKNYPKCTFVASIPPTNIQCPQCNYAMGEKHLKIGDILECLKCKYRIDAQTHEPIVSKTSGKKTSKV